MQIGELAAMVGQPSAAGCTRTPSCGRPSAGRGHPPGHTTPRGPRYSRWPRRAERAVSGFVRRVVVYQARATANLWPWIRRRRQDVGPGDVALGYARERVPVLIVLAGVLCLETAIVGLLLPLACRACARCARRAPSSWYGGDRGEPTPLPPRVICSPLIFRSGHCLGDHGSVRARR